MDRPQPAQDLRALILIREQRRSAHSLALQQRRGGARSRVGQFEGAQAQVSVVEQVVAAAKINQLAHPLSRRSRDQLHPTLRESFNVDRRPVTVQQRLIFRS